MPDLVVKTYDFCTPYLPHRHMPLLVSEQVDVDVGADVGWPLEVDVVFPETLHSVERPRLTAANSSTCDSSFRFQISGFRIYQTRERE